MRITLIGFNSTLVRLKVQGMQVCQIAPLLRFNSTLVRLKVNELDGCRNQGIRFNSTLVRLKGGAMCST